MTTDAGEVVVLSDREGALLRALSSAAQSDSPREAPLDVFLAVYDDGRLAVSRNMPSGLPDEEALAEVAETGVARRDTVTGRGEQQRDWRRRHQARPRSAF